MIDRKVVVAVFAGALAGGLLRYELGAHWETGRFPWPIFTVNTVGAFVLAAVVVLTDRPLKHTRYVRPLIGTGFCGSLTTFSSVVTTVDLLTAHGDAGLAACYLALSIVGGLMAGAVGFVVTRKLTHDDAAPDPAAVS